MTKTVTDILNLMSDRFLDDERALIQRDEWDTVVAELMAPDDAPDATQHFAKLVAEAKGYQTAVTALRLVRDTQGGRFGYSWEHVQAEVNRAIGTEEKT